MDLALLDDVVRVGGAETCRLQQGVQLVLSRHWWFQGTEMSVHVFGHEI